jgi:Polyketide cyclase / dehydrase and lipid transport
MAKSFRTIGLDFIDSAPKRTVVRVHFGHPPAAVFAALADAPGWGRWYPGFSAKSHYLTPAPYGVGSRREMIVFGRPTIETILAWDEPSRWAFAIEEATMPGISALAENYSIAGEAGGGSSLTWTMALDASMRASGVIVGAAARATFRKAAKKLDRLLAGT